jgi:predicted RND superfamily exporter protein
MLPFPLARAGFIHFWGLTIDNVSVIFVVISLGLSVDYSVHITHSFLHKEGTGNERMVAALEDMGTAVMNGGSPPLHRRIAMQLR